MMAFLRFLAQYAFLIFLLLAGAAVFAIQRLVKNRAEQKATLFALELELARRKINQTIALIALIGVFVLIELILVLFLVPNLPAASILASPTLDPLATIVSTLPPEVLQTLGAATANPTSTPQTSGCIPGQIMITAPTAGEEVRGQITLEGTADIPNFGYYKYEFALQGTDTWNSINVGTKPKHDEELGLWYTSEITPGDYLLRLVVTDNQGNALPACVVPVRILAP
jgi:hypothetical protein